MFERLSLEASAYIGYVKVKVWIKNGQVHYAKNVMTEDEEIIDAVRKIPVEDLIKRIEKLGIEGWKDECQNQVCEYYDAGYYWTVKYKDSEKGTITLKGRAVYPSKWDEFLKLLSDIAGNLWFLSGDVID